MASPEQIPALRRIPDNLPALLRPPGAMPGDEARERVGNLVAIVLIAALTALTFEGQLSAARVLSTGGRLVVFLAGSFAVGI